MTIAITGATGFLGGYLVDYFARKRHHIIAFGRRPTFAHTDRSDYRRWDISKESITIPDRIDVVVHCAGAVSDWGGYEEMHKTNVVGTENVLRTFQNAGQFIHISTASVYDPSRPKNFAKESEPYSMRYVNNYGKTKMEAEKVVVQAFRSNKIIIRPHIIYGPGDTTLLPRLLKARKAGRMLVIGDGANELSLTYVDNLAYAIECVMDKQFDCEVFNITDKKTDTLNGILLTFLKAFQFTDQMLHIPDGVAMPLAELLVVMYKAFGSKHAPFITPYAVTQLCENYTLDISKAEQLLNYHPTIDYLEGFTHTYDWFKGVMHD